MANGRRRLAAPESFRRQTEMNAADRIRIRQWTSQACMITMICLAVTAPAIVLSPALPYFKAEQLLVPLVLGLYLWLLAVGVARPIRFHAMLVIGFLYFVCNALSMWYGAQILGHTVILRDWYELPKVWLPVAFFIIAYEADLTERSLHRLITVFSFAILAVCVYAWSQFLGLSFTYKLNPYYSPGGHIDATLAYAQRVYATVGNANVLGELMTWCVVLFVLAALFRVGSSLRNILVALSCLITLVMTGSRYGLLTVSLGFVLILALASTTGRRRLAQVFFLLLLLPVFAWTYQTVATSNRRTLERYQTLRDPLQTDSLRQRLDDVWLEAIGDFKTSPLLGHGPGKGFLPRGDRFIDSEYLNVLRERGIIGFLMFLCYYFYPLYLIGKGRQAVRTVGPLAEQVPAHAVSVYATFIMGTLALIMDIGMSTFYNPFLQGILWLWLGVGAGSAARLSALVPARRASYAPAILFGTQKAPSV
jgi:O-antigen ligase